MDFSKIVTCGFCNNVAQMKIIGSVGDIIEDIDPGHGASREYGSYYEVIRCPKCEEANIVRYFWHDGMDSKDEVIYEILHPVNKKIPLGLPDEIRNTFKAAEQVKSIEVNAYAILMRRLLELVCIDREANGKTLAKMLENLADKNEIPIKLVKIAKGLKDFGNIGAHAGIGKLTIKEIPIVESLTRAILEYVYSAPYLAAVAEHKLKTIKGK